MVSCRFHLDLFRSINKSLYNVKRLLPAVAEKLPPSVLTDPAILQNPNFVLHGVLLVFSFPFRYNKSRKGGVIHV